MKSELELLLEQNHIDINSEEFKVKFAEVFAQKLKENIEKTDLSTVDNSFTALLKISTSKNDEERLACINRALEIDPDCLEAKLLLTEYKKGHFETIKYLKKILEEARVKLTKEGYFKKQNIGHFMDEMSTASYIAGLYELMLFYIDLDGFKRAIYLGEEMKRLDHTDAKHVHFDLLGLYAQVDDDQKINKMCKNCDNKCILYYIARMVLYFKKGNFKKAKEYLEEIIKINPFFITYFEDEVDEPKDAKEVEVFKIVSNYYYLFENDYLKEFIVKKGDV